MTHPSFERILNLKQEPGTNWSQIEDDICEVLDQISNIQSSFEQLSATTQKYSQGDCVVLGKQIEAVLSGFTRIRLDLLSQIEDYHEWGSAWREYAITRMPPEHRVRFQLEQSTQLTP